MALGLAQRPRLAAAAALTAGAAFPLAFAPLSLLPLAVLAPAVLFLGWSVAGPGRSAWLGWLFGVGMFGVGVSWVYVSMNRYGNMPGPMAAVAVAGFVAGLALFPAACGALQARLAPRVSLARVVLVAPGCWILLEWVRGWILTGFPWLSTGYAAMGSVADGLVPWLGVHGVGLLLAVSAGAVAALAMWPRRGAWVLAVVALAWAGAGAAGRVDFAEPDGPPLRVALVQGNVPLGEKWQTGGGRRLLSRYLEMSRPYTNADLVVWPEAALPFYADQLPADARRRLESWPATFLLGTLERDRSAEGGERRYNSALLVGGSGGVYRKRHLVPFGEFLPLEPLLGWLLTFLEIPQSDLSAWKGPQQPLRVDGRRLGVTICYEDAFPADVRRALPEAAVLANLSEDAWFGDSLAPHQRLQMARMRALESARPMVRAGNTGPSALIDHRGRVSAVAGQFRATVVSGTVQPMAGVTPYVRTGDWPAVALAVLLALAGTLATRAPATRSRDGGARPG